MGCHTWFFRPIKEGEKADDYCEYGDNYTDKDTTHDVFRIGGYPEDKLLSYEETIEFCSKNNIPLDDNQIDILKKFWLDNPEGVIEFG